MSLHTHTHTHIHTHTHTHTHTLIHRVTGALLLKFASFHKWIGLVSHVDRSLFTRKSLFSPFLSRFSSWVQPIAFEVSCIQSQISIDHLVVQVSFATFRWNETNEIDIGDWDWNRLQMWLAARRAQLQRRDLCCAVAWVCLFAHVNRSLFICQLVSLQLLIGLFSCVIGSFFKNMYSRGAETRPAALKVNLSHRTHSTKHSSDNFFNRFPKHLFTVYPHQTISNLHTQKQDANPASRQRQQCDCRNSWTR